MQAEYGSPEISQIKGTKKPIPKPDEILIKVKATAVNSGDVRVRSLPVNDLMRIAIKIVLGFFGPCKHREWNFVSTLFINDYDLMRIFHVVTSFLT